MRTNILKFKSNFSIIFIGLLLFGISFQAAATKWETKSDGSWNTNSTWVGNTKPSFDWSNPIDTVVINHDINMNINVTSTYAVIIINSGASLINTSKNLTIGHTSTLINNGSIEVKQLNLDWNALLIENNSTIEINGNSTYNDGTFTNDGTLTSDFNLTNNANFINNGTLSVKNFTNEDYLENVGTINLEEDLNLDWSSVTVNDGIINVSGDLVNQGDFTSTGDIVVEGDLEVDWGTSFTTSGELVVSGDMTNRGSLTNSGALDVGGKLLNDWSSTISNTGDLAVADNLTNNGTLDNDGTTQIDGDLINNNEIVNTNLLTVSGELDNAYAEITNTGSLEVTGDFVNTGGTVDNTGDVLVDGTVSNTGGSFEGTGVLCSTDGSTDPTGGNPSGVNNEICGSFLPVQLISFTAVTSEMNVNLIWTTASEKNNQGFNVLRSTDGFNFEIIGFVKGNGSTSSMNTYSFVDENSASGVIYYQLKQIDFDGKFKYSKIVSTNKTSVNEFIVYPNPVQNGSTLTIQIESEISNPILVNIIDLQGKLVFSQNVSSSKIEIETSELKEGLYMIQLIDNLTVTNKKVMISK